MKATTGTAWLLGLVLGALDGFLGFEFPFLALLLAAIASILFAANRRTMAGIGGLLLAAGVLWALVLVNAVRRCEAFNSVPGQECQMGGDVTPYVLGALAAAAVGFGLSVAARWRRAA